MGFGPGPIGSLDFFGFFHGSSQALTTWLPGTFHVGRYQMEKHPTPPHPTTCPTPPYHLPHPHPTCPTHTPRPPPPPVLGPPPTPRRLTQLIEVDEPCLRVHAVRQRLKVDGPEVPRLARPGGKRMWGCGGGGGGCFSKDMEWRSVFPVSMWFFACGETKERSAWRETSKVQDSFELGSWYLCRNGFEENTKESVLGATVPK